MNRLAYWVLILPPLFWAGNFTIGKAISGQIYPVTLAYWRWLLAGLMLLPFVVRPMWQQRELIFKHWWILLVLAFLGVTTYNTLAYFALSQTTTTNASLLYSVTPILILLLSVLFFGGRVSIIQMFGVILSFCGVLSIFSQLSLAKFMSLNLNPGDQWMMVAMLIWALYSLLLKAKKPVGLNNKAYLGFVIIFGSLMLSPLYLLNPLNEPSLPVTPQALLSLAYVSIFPSILAFYAWHYGVEKLGASIAGQYLHLVPFFGVILAVIFLGETVRSYHLVSVIFIATGLYLSLKSKSKPDTPTT